MTPGSSPPPRRAIDRREALRRAALVLAGVIAGCEARRSPAAGWRPRALSTDQAELVATVAEHILPETDTPGARAVGVHRFIDAMLAESYPAPERERFLSGLADLDARAQRSCGRPFLQCATQTQRTLLDQLDGAAFVTTPERDVVPFFRTLKELTLLGYYTSEIGATRELHNLPV